MKKMIFAIALMLWGCDSSPTSPNSQKIVVNDTNIQITNILNITGKIIQKTASSSTNSGFSAVVCLEKSRVCAKTNSSGQYQLKNRTPTALARSLSQIDTVITPEKIVDTVKTDTTITLDTVIRNDTTFIYHNMHITTGNAPLYDSVKIYSNARVLYEIPVTSWNSVLPDKYIVQRNISGAILKNQYYGNVRKVQAVYFGKDSLAYVITLEQIDSSYSGFIYEPYDDSSFKTGNKTNNIFVRILDFNDTVWGVSNVVSYSERSGDLNNVFGVIVPGAIQRYPRQNVFAVLQNGANVKTVISNINSIPVSGWVAIDSIFKTSQVTIDSQYMIEEISRNRVAKMYIPTQVFLNVVDSGRVDSFEVSFKSDRTFTTILGFSNDSTILKQPYGRNIAVDSGMNYYRFKYDWKIRRTGVDGYGYDIFATVFDSSVTDMNIRLHFK